MVIIKKLVHFLANITYILIILYVAVCIPMLFQYNPVVVLSGSMEPTYKIGSVVYYQKNSSNQLKVGDVIVFSSSSHNNRLVCHRIHEMGNGLVTTKGDANDNVDTAKTNIKDIKGKVANFQLIYIGYYIQFVNEHLIPVVIVFVIILVSEFLICNTGIFDIYRNKERSEEHGRKEEK